MKPATFLGFDFGERHTGIAAGSTHTGRAQSLSILALHHGAPDWTKLDRLVAEWKPDALVVGLPLNMNDSESRITKAARAFGNRLKGRYNLPVHMVDERLSSRAATDALLAAGVPVRRHKHHIDKVAAQTILQAFLDEHGKRA